jgi:primosomal protein N'
MNIVSVLPITKHSPENELTYYSSLALAPGDVVKIPLGRRVITGIVRKITMAKDAKYSVRNASFELKKIISKVGESIFDKKVFDSIETIANYSFVKSGDIAEIVMPRTIREEIKDGVLKKSTPRLLENGAIFGPLESRIKFFKPLVREYLGNGKSIFVVVPSIFDLDLFSEKFGRGIEQLVIKLSHSETSKKILNNIKEIKNSKKGYLVVGTASYLASVVDSISVVVIENENSGYYSNSLFGFDIKKFIEVLTFKFNLPLIYSDRYLSSEIWKEIRENKLKLKKNDYRLGLESPITLIRKPDKKMDKTFIGEKAISILKEKTSQRLKGFVMSQRNGYAPATICKDCGHFVTCPTCVRPLVLYHLGDDKSFFKCNTCELELTTNTVCSNCGGWQLYSIGAGSEKIYKELSSHFKKSHLFLLDSAKKQTEKKKIIENFKRIDGSLLVSTLQYLIMSQKDIDFSFIPSFNSFATIPTYKITERILDTISYLKILSKEIIIEDYEDLSFILNDVVDENIEQLQTKELSLRDRLSLPPYHTLIKIKIKNKESDILVEDTKMIMDILKNYEPEKYRLAYKDKKTREIIQNILIRVPKESWQIRNGEFLNDPDLFEILESLGKPIEIDSSSLF